MSTADIPQTMSRSSWRPTAATAVLFLGAGLANAAGIRLVVPLLIAASVACTRAALDATGCSSRTIRLTVYGTLAARWVLALGFYFASLYHWPIGRSLQVGNGFWLFCMDALNYHTWAPQILNALNWGLPLPDPSATIDYYLVVALIYGAFGASPLTGIAINILAWTLATVLLLGLFSDLRGRPVPVSVATVILLWPAGLIWPTQLMKDSLAFLFLVLAAASAVAMVDMRRRLASVLPAAALFAIVFVPLLRMRVYVGRLVLGSAVVAAGVALVWVLLERQAWRSLLGAASVWCIAYLGLVFILAPDPFVVLAPAEPGLAYFHYGQALQARQDYAGARAAFKLAVAADPTLTAATTAAEALNDSVSLVRPEPGAAGLPSRWAQAASASRRLKQSLEAAAIFSRFRSAGSIDAAAPSALGITREKFSATGGGSALDEGTHLNGWRDLIRVAPGALADGLFAPFPWDVFRPRGITGVFRTLAASESVLMFLLVPALVLGVSRLRRPEEWLVLAIAGSGLLGLGLVITNIGTLVRLRAAFTLLLVAFASYGFDVYGLLLAAATRRRRPPRSSADFNLGA